jgi:basic membrane lipoprotein Med (substrate-binding protein (PBP1-ABC) superfamily)
MIIDRRHVVKLAAIAAASVGSLGRLSLARADGLRMRGIFETPMEEPFVTQLHLAMTKVAGEMGIDYQHSESVKAADFSRVLRQWCDEGIELIVGDAYGTEQICRRVAADFPKTAFTMGSAAGVTEPNFSTFYGVTTEAAYLAGMLASWFSRSGKIGVVAGPATPSTYGLLNAYRAGAKEVKTDVVFKAAYIGSFFDPPKAKEAAIAMIDQGVDVIYAERIGVIEACAEKGGFAIGNMTDQSAINPKVVLTSVIWDPYPVIKSAADQVKAGTYKAQDFSVLENVAHGGNYLSPFGSFESQIPDDVKAKLKARHDEIASGAFSVPYDESETKSD